MNREVRTEDIGVIMAAGLGKRMLPLTKDTAKPLIPVLGTPMIETVIKCLVKRNVLCIYVITGYKSEQFVYLTKKYSNVVLIENTEYEEKNNISSLKAAEQILQDKNCFICEADLYIRDDTLLLHDFDKSCYFGKYKEGYSDDWVFVTDNGRVVRVKKGGSDLYNMVGISYWLRDDIAKISEAIARAYAQPGHGELFWDEIADREVDNIYLQVHPVDEEQIFEVDTPEELFAINKRFAEGKV